MITEGLTAIEEGRLIDLCGKVGTKMSRSFYNAVAAKFVMTGIEAVTLRHHRDRVEILLTQRAADDAYWPGQWHSPGSILRAADAPAEPGVVGSYDAAFRRVENEIGTSFAHISGLVGSVFHRTHRGPENCLVFVCQLAGEPQKGSFFPVDSLPEPFIDSQRSAIEMAVRAFKAQS